MEYIRALSFERYCTTHLLSRSNRPRIPAGASCWELHNWNFNHRFGSMSPVALNISWLSSWYPKMQALPFLLRPFFIVTYLPPSKIPSIPQIRTLYESPQPPHTVILHNHSENLRDLENFHNFQVWSFPKPLWSSLVQRYSSRSWGLMFSPTERTLQLAVIFLDP